MESGMPFPNLSPSWVFRDFGTDGIPSSGKHDPLKPYIRRVLSEMQDAIIALIGEASGDIVLSRGVITYTVTGETVDAIVVESDAEIPDGPGMALFILSGVTAANTGPVTINGKPLRTNSSNEIAPGGLTVGSVHAFVDLGDHFRLLSDQASAAIVAAAEAAAAGLSLPSIAAGDAGKMLVVKNDETGYDLRDERDVVRVASRVELADLDVTKAPVALVYGEGGRNGTFVFLAGDQSALVALDPSEIIYIAPASDASGAGSVWARQSADFIDVRWAGAVSSTFVNQSVAIQAAIDLAQELDVFVAFAPGANYRVESSLVFKHGAGASDPKRLVPRLNGNGATLFPVGTGMYALNVESQCLLADKSTGRGEAEISLKGLIVDGGLDSTARAVSIGRPGYWLRNFSSSLLDDIIAIGFTSDKTVSIIESRRIEFRDLVCRDAQLYIASETADSFTGDLHFYNLEITGATHAKPGFQIYAAAEAAAAEVRGVRFWSSTFYAARYGVDALANGFVGDIWLNSCQFDNQSTQTDTSFLTVSASGSNALIDGVHVSNCYFVYQVSGTLVFAQAQSGGEVRGVLVRGNQFGQCTPSSGFWNTWLVMIGVDGAVVAENVFNINTSQPTDASAVRFFGC